MAAGEFHELIYEPACSGVNFPLAQSYDIDWVRISLYCTYAGSPNIIQLKADDIVLLTRTGITTGTTWTQERDLVATGIGIVTPNNLTVACENVNISNIHVWFREAAVNIAEVPITIGIAVPVAEVPITINIVMPVAEVPITIPIERVIEVPITIDIRGAPPIPCTEGDTKCIGPDLYECIDGKWVLKEADSEECVAPPEGIWEWFKDYWPLVLGGSAVVIALLWPKKK